jgi:hypothetical protein
VLYRFTPRAPRLTDCEVTWLVNGSAVEGKDYDLATLTWLWTSRRSRTSGSSSATRRRRLALLRAGSAVFDGRFHAAFPALAAALRDSAAVAETAPQITQE